MISSRQASNAGHFVEHAITLNIDQLVKAGGLRPGWRTSGQLNWTLTSGESISVNFETNLAIPAGHLHLDFVVREGTTGSDPRVTQTIALTTNKPHFGGTRWWFVCPCTKERVGRLHLPPGASHFASRRAHGLSYACQTEDVYERAARRARKLITGLGGEVGTFWMPLKPKGMRWTTYVRHADQIKRFERIADGRWLKTAARLKAIGLI